MSLELCNHTLYKENSQLNHKYSPSDLCTSPQGHQPFDASIPEFDFQAFFKEAL